MCGLLWAQGEKAKLGPVNNFTACIYIYIYAYGCLIEPHLVHFMRA